MDRTFNMCWWYATALKEKGYNVDVDKIIKLGYIHNIGKYKGESHGHVMKEYEYDIDIMKVVFMLAVHELGEIVIGDLTMFEISKEEKAKREKEAVHKILCGLLDGKEIENLFKEFDSHSTKEAMFAYQCDKLECDLQSKLYDEEGCVDLNKQESNDLLENELVKKLLSEEKSWSGMWLRFGQTVYPYDDNFKNVSKYALNNSISKKGLNK